MLPDMDDPADFIQAVLAIVRDPKVWEARVAEMRAHAESVAQMQAEVSAAGNAAAEHRKVAETALARATSAQAAADDFHKRIKAREDVLAEREAAAQAHEAANIDFEHRVKARDATVSEASNTLDHRKAELVEIEASADRKLAEAQALLATYDADKHKALQKIAD